MLIQDIRTAQDLRIYLEDHVKIDNVNLVDAIEWYVATTESSFASDYDRKDMAHLFLHGLTPIKNNPKAVDGFIGTFFEDYDHFLAHRDEINGEELEAVLKDAVEIFEITLKEHFGERYTP